MLEVRETRLPGVGTKFTLRTARGEKVSSVVHLDGMREIYHYTDEDEEPHVLTLNDEEARQLGAIIGGVVYRPQLVEDLELALKDLVMEWIELPADEPARRADRGDLPHPLDDRRDDRGDPARVRLPGDAAPRRGAARRRHAGGDRTPRELRRHPAPGGGGPARLTAAVRLRGPGRREAPPRPGLPAGGPGRAWSCRSAWCWRVLIAVALLGHDHDRPRLPRRRRARAGAPDGGQRAADRPAERAERQPRLHPAGARRRPGRLHRRPRPLPDRDGHADARSPAAARAGGVRRRG